MKAASLPFALLLLLLPAVASAHPLSQGALDVDLRGTTLHLRATVPLEEVLLASQASNLDEAREDHGAYFLAHVGICADGQNVDGAMTSNREIDSDHVLYEFDYKLSETPGTLVLRQDILREVLYAPGNPWEASFVVTYRVDGRTVREAQLLTSGAPLELVAQPQSRAELFGSYVRHGLTHILGGYDHLLFVVALALATASFRDLVLVIGAFTVAHSITLALSVLGVVRLPEQIVEPMIAASIVLVALSNVLWPQRSRGTARLAVAFFFGLFHGLGFAGGLLDAMAGLPSATVGLAIVAFSVGVELGHQAIVLPVFGALSALRSSGLAESTRDAGINAIQRYGSVAISLAGFFYLLSALR